MKIRSNFVTNSSSSSFCIYGYSFEKGDSDELSKEAIWKFIRKHIVLKEDSFNQELNEDDPYIQYEYLEEALNKVGLEIHDPSCHDCWYIGRCFSTIRDDETGKEFKEETKKVLKDLTGEDVKCGILEEAYYD